MGKSEIGITEIMESIPHRFPFLMIDRVLEYGPERAVAIKNVTINEPYFSGHFPRRPIMPGMLIGEAMAQTAAFIRERHERGESVSGGGGSSEKQGAGLTALLIGMNLKLHHPVTPGDQLELTAELVKRFGRQMRIKASARVGKRKVASAEITVAYG